MAVNLVDFNVKKLKLGPIFMWCGKQSEKNHFALG